MSVTWAATSPKSGRFHPVERRSEVKDLSDRFNDLRSRGQGYIEVRPQNSQFPILTLAFRDDHAVIHLLSTTEQISLLTGDGTVPSAAEIKVPIMDDLTTFTGAHVLSTERAWDLVHNFTQTGAADALDKWYQL
ncbi:hypothetical protein OHB05_42295 [Streptomyces sp. NBC_00638]|uniref:hypothetical protein n=1 Tax=Streptomyces sp. NBC_00638 TaxID=2975794 RepID=UPI0022593DD0|nr:hypothetical protein [Streptomyces sp. NBC_00638]MCX5009151.1 hypothetical protein [Streptomyces sp. NBC_00638]